MHRTIKIGTAGWNIPKSYASEFSGDGTHLARYARRFSAVEINSSFYRPHKPDTYARWAASVPDDFRFSVKLPREISHDRKLADAAAPLDKFLAEIDPLGNRLGPILIQLAPSLRYDEIVVEAFLKILRDRFNGDIVCEPRNATWFTAEANLLLAQFRIARVAADPVLAEGAGEPGGWPNLIYRRLHGAPKIYYSAYSLPELKNIAGKMLQSAQTQWCIFDNTTLGEATGNALTLMVETRS